MWLAMSGGLENEVGGGDEETIAETMASYCYRSQFYPMQ